MQKSKSAKKKKKSRLDLTPKAKTTETKINKVGGYIKLKILCTAKEAINRMKR